MNSHRDEAELDLDWRLKELNFYHNLLVSADEKDKNKIYRMIITMFYAHYEGYVYFLFNLYIKHINNQEIPCASVKPVIAAASLADVLHELRNVSRVPKHLVTKNYPEDIIQIARDTEFIENINMYLNNIVRIPDKAISTDSNLKMGVLKPILFRLGFSQSTLDNMSGDITSLVNYRNTIAHGARSKPLTKQEYDIIRQKTIDIMLDIRNHIIESIENRAYINSSLHVDISFL